MRCDDLMLIKAECGENSRMSRTQKTRRLDLTLTDTTNNIRRQYAHIDKHINKIVVFNVNADIIIPNEFLFIGKCMLQENKHTQYSFSNSIEYALIYARTSMKDIVSQHFIDLQNVLNKICIHPRCVNLTFMEWISLDPDFVKTRSWTTNQTEIAMYYQSNMKDTDVFAINVNGSFKFLANGRKPNGKIQSMSGPAIITKVCKYKLSTKGVYLYRDIPIPKKYNNNDIRHTIHPEFVRLVVKIFS